MASPLHQPDTIAAIATATGPAGVGIVRISGPEAFAIADKLTRSRKPLQRHRGHSLHRATAYDPVLDEPIDDGLVALFHGPRSFTGEDVVEFQGHGGTITLTRLFAAILHHGARAARPGEFSERAFVNGKLDLSQAEAIADLVSAGTVTAQRAARRQTSGELSFAIQSCTQYLHATLAFIEATIDFPEDVGELDAGAVAQLLQQTEQTLEALVASASYGIRLREGITLVLTGRPNVGKSSLLNALSGTDRAIVTPIAGTTRDVIEEQVNIEGIPVRALDTAGLRDTDDPVERIGVERAVRAVADADMVIVVLEANTSLTEAEQNQIDSLRTRPVVIALNKSDLADPTPLLATLPSDIPAVPVSASSQTGIDALRRTIASVITQGASEQNTLPLVTSSRHEVALRRALRYVQQALASLDAEREPELLSVDVFAALQSLGEITGETAREEIIAGIFARFCIGK